jgi:starch-binding outer membrane protein, SusD/RagB family
MKLFKLIFISVGLIFLASCEDFLEEKPFSVTSPDSFYKKANDFNTASLGMYSFFNDSWYCWYVPTTLNGIAWENGIPTQWPEYSLSFDASYTLSQDFWTGYYDLIGHCNMLLKQIETTSIESDKMPIYTGEAYFIRALAYFDLVRLFGDVPLSLIPPTSVDESLKPRSPISQVYLQIENDLKRAEELLPVSNPFNEGRATLGAAKGLLAKVYVTMAGKPLYDDSKWQQARTKLLEIIDETNPQVSKSPFNYGLESNFQKLFVNANIVGGLGHQDDVVEQANENGIESVFEINYAGSTDAQSCIFPWSGAYASRAVNAWLGNLFEKDETTNDFRKDVTMNLSWPTRQRKFPRCGTSWNNHECNWYILRYADLLLLLAEVENEINSPTNLAVSALNLLRERARNADGTSRALPLDTDLSAVLTASTMTPQDSLREIIYSERMIELANEGQIWFDWLRTDRAKTMIEYQNRPNRDYAQKIELLPIPKQEILLSKGVLVQNPGY